MHYNSTPYFYILNLQGDVIRMIDGNGNTVANYEYDPYGKVISATGTLADINPIRYRGYYYDHETGLYHLWSRYYDPQTGRFISADSLASTGQGMLGYNMFAYCRNNPISRKDALGTASFDVVLDGVDLPFDDWIDGETGGGYSVPGVSSSYFAMQNVREYDSWWRNSYYNSNMTWSNGAISPQALTVTPKESQRSTDSHISGVGSPQNNVNPGGSYAKLDSNGNLYSYTQFDVLGRQTMRIDFQGRPHAGVLPHIHLYSYPLKGGRSEYIFDLEWHLIN